MRASATATFSDASPAAIVRLAVLGEQVANEAATSTLSIVGTFEVNLALYARGGVTDPNGLYNAAYPYQWIRVDGATETEITDANTAAYTIQSADVGKTLKVRVSFSDDAGYPEAVVSPATPTIRAAESYVVTNLGQTGGISYFGTQTGLTGFAQKFTTGTAGATLNKAKLESIVPEASTITAEIWSDSSGSPGSSLHTFGMNSGTTLLANTDYWLVVQRATGTDNFRVTVNRIAGTDDGGAASWSIDGNIWYYWEPSSIWVQYSNFRDPTAVFTMRMGLQLATEAGLAGVLVDHPGTVALSWRTPAMDSPLTATLTDPDGVTGDTWTWSWSDTSTGTFTPITGENTATYTPVTEDVGRYLKAAVTYTDAFGAQSAEQVSENPTATQPPPEFAEDVVTFTVDENATMGTVGTVTAMHPGGETITYSATNPEIITYLPDGTSFPLRNFNEDFSLNTSTGEITVKPDATINSEFSVVDGSTYFAEPYQITITATDTAGGTGTVNVTINITDVDEPGFLTFCCPPSHSLYSYVGALADALFLHNDLHIGLTDEDKYYPPGRFLPTLTDKTYTWSWSTTRDGSFTTISGADTLFYVPVQADLGRFLRVTVTYTDRFGPDKSVTATTTYAVEANPPPPVISGILEVGLRAAAQYDRAYLPSGYLGGVFQWLRVDGDSETEIRSYSGANTYIIQEADFGKRLKVRIRYKRVGSVSLSTDPADYLVYTSDASDVVRGASSYLGSNLGVTTPTSLDTTRTDYRSFEINRATATALAQGFTTGINPAELTAVRLQAMILGPIPTVSIYSDDSGVPGTSLHVLTNPETIDPLGTNDGDRRIGGYGYLTAEDFTASGVTLSANTKYWVVVEDMGIGFTNSPDQALGWSIDDSLYQRFHALFRADGTWGMEVAGHGPLRIGFLGTQIVTAPSFATKPLTFTVDENAASGAVVGTAGATDTDGDPLTEYVSGTDVDAFNNVFDMSTSSGEITVKDSATVDHETKESYTVTISVTDGEDASGVMESTATVDDTVALTITVTDINEPGTVALTAAAPEVGSALTATLTDGDADVSGETWTWSWSTTSTGSFTTISGETTATYTPETTDVGRYLKASVTYTDAFGPGQTAEQVSDNAVLTNPPPVFADDPVAFTVNENATSGTVGTVTATDPDGETITYSVGGVDETVFNEDFSLNTSTGEITVKFDATIDHESRPSYSVTITATDPSGGTDAISVTITVTDVDELGTVALSRATPALGLPLTAALTDPDGGVTGATWTWSWSTTSTGIFTTISGANTATYTPGTGDVGRYLKASVSYTDSLDSGKSASQTADNATGANPPPVFPFDSDTFTVNENATTGRIGTVTATDPDGEAITYSVGGTDETAFNEDFSLDTSSGEINVKSDGTIDFESKHSYSITVTATDPFRGVDTINVTIRVQDVNEPGTVTLPTPPVVARPFTPSLTDPDSTFTNSSWVWSKAPFINAGFTTIPGATNKSYTPVQADYSHYLKVTWTYEDQYGPGQTAEAISEDTVVNNPLPVFPNASETFRVNENATTGTVGTVTATDPDGETITYSVIGGVDETVFNEDFNLDASTGEITVKSDATINFESKASYLVTIRATDTALKRSTVNVTINVTDVDEPGTLALSQATPALDTPLTATLTEPDGGGVSSPTWSWSSASTRTGSFSTIPGANIATYRPVQTDVGRFLRATVSYTDSFRSGQTASQTADNATVSNPPPVFAVASVTFTVDENATMGTVGTVTATDPADEALTYSVGGTDETAFNEDFTLDASTGEITVKSDATIDHERRPSYSLRITAMDPSGGTDAITVTITVTNVDELGTVTLSRATPAVGSALTATLTDPDGGITGRTWTWSWSTTRTGSFTTVSGANTATYTPASGDVGRYLKAAVSYTDSFDSGKDAQTTSTNAVVAKTRRRYSPRTR